MTSVDTTQRQIGTPPPVGERIPDEVAFPVGRIRFRAAELSDAPALLAVLDRTFNRWPGFVPGRSREDHVRWYLDSWRPDQRLNWVGDHDGRLAAFSLGYSRPTWLRGSLEEGSLGAFDGVDSDYRRMYFYNWFRAWRAQVDGRVLAFSFTQVEAMKRTQSHVGDFRPIANALGVFLRVFRPLDASARTGGARLKRAPGYLALRAVNELRHRPAPSPSWSIRETAAFDARVDALDEACATEFDLLASRGHDFLNWRYLEPRTGPSVAFLAEQGNELLGYAVLRTVGVRAHIADLLVAPGRVDVARSLVDACVRRARANGSAAIECTLPGQHPYMPALRTAGFARLRARSRVLAEKFNVASWSPDPHHLDFLADPHARVHVMMGDSDMV